MALPRPHALVAGLACALLLALSAGRPGGVAAAVGPPLTAAATGGVLPSATPTTQASPSLPPAAAPSPAPAGSSSPVPSPGSTPDVAAGDPVAGTAALTTTGTSADGWTRYALADARLPDRLAPGTAFRGEVHLDVGGLRRTVRLLVPPSAGPHAPLLLALHGLYQTVAGEERAQGWEAVARAHGVVLAYPVGTAASWDAGTCCGRAASTRVDDVAYLDRVVQVASALHAVDARRLYVTGFSNGAMMAYRYACERPSKVAAVLAVSGTVTADCHGRSDVAVLAVHGSADHTVPLGGLAWSGSLSTRLSAVSATARVFGPRISAQVLPGFGHGWPSTARGGYDTTRSGWTWLARQSRPR